MVDWGSWDSRASLQLLEKLIGRLFNHIHIQPLKDDHWPNGLVRWHLHSTICYDIQLLDWWLWQVRAIIERLVRRCGMDSVAKVMPQEHMKLLTNIRKVSPLSWRNIWLCTLRKLSVWWCESQFFLYICICTYNQLVRSESSYYTFCDLRSSSLQSYRQKSRQKERRKVLMEEKRVMPSLLHLEQAQPSTDSFTTLPWLFCYVF